MFLLIKLLWVICPILVFILLKEDKYSKIRKFILTFCLCYLLLYLIPIFAGFGYKASIFNYIAFITAYISVVFGFLYMLKKVKIKRKWLRICYKVFLLYPSITLYAIITAFIVYVKDNNYNENEIFYREEYTVTREVEWADNMKEYAAISIYKDVKYFPFLFRKIYEDKGYNSSLERVEYDKKENTIILTTSRWDGEMIDRIKLDKYTE